MVNWTEGGRTVEGLAFLKMLRTAIDTLVNDFVSDEMLPKVERPIEAMTENLEVVIKAFEEKVEKEKPESEQEMLDEYNQFKRD